MLETKTEGEKLFERYLTSQGLSFEFEKEYQGKAKRPDYAIRWEDSPVLIDVKDFESPLPSGVGAFDPYPPIREKIAQGCKKFKEYKNFCCALALFNNNAFVMIQNADFVLGSMYGDSGFTFPINIQTGVGSADLIERKFLGRGKMVRPHWSHPQNTTISALITVTAIRPHYVRLVEMLGTNIKGRTLMTIEECEAELQLKDPTYNTELEIPRVIVWHNAVARIPFPSNLFCGPYDTHFGVAKREDGSLEQRVTFRGSRLPVSVRL